MINTHVAFDKGIKGELFTIQRIPDEAIGHLIYVQPLFELTNVNRHVFTKSAMSNYHLGFSSNIYDHYATGDSEGELLEASIKLWQEDLFLQITHYQKNSELPITLIAFSSAALLITEKIIGLVNSVQLWQPEFKGKNVVKQMKRLLLLDNQKSSINEGEIEVAGYLFRENLFDELKKALFHVSPETINKVLCIDILEDDNQFIAKTRAEVTELFKLKGNYFSIVDLKYWQASELLIPKKLLTFSSTKLTKAFADE